MRSLRFGMCALLTCGAMSAPALAQQRPAAPRAAAPRSETKTAAPATARDPQEQPIRAVAEAYTKAYNAHDAKAIAALFTPEAQIVDRAGDTIQGRDAIELVFAGLFAEYPQARTTLAIKGIRFLNAGLAVENGIANVALVPGEAPEPNDYVVLHVKQDGKWLMVSAHDMPSDSAPPEAHLKQLEWLVGEWVDESPESIVFTNYRWDEGKHFILSEFSINIAGKAVMNGTQRIGWDPLEKVIRSWTFDSQGGFSEGVYSRDGQSWVIKMTGVTHDGKSASATNVITRAGNNTMTWQSRDRVVGGEPQSDIAEVTVVHTPPKPM
ncbi:MAG: SgcJ/EcaC family oxidoreductase [Pirellulales bacterium]